MFLFPYFTVENIGVLFIVTFSKLTTVSLNTKIYKFKRRKEASIYFFVMSMFRTSGLFLMTLYLPVNVNS